MVYVFSIYIVRPLIDNASPSISTVSDRNISLYCHAVGMNSPRITWEYSNGTQIINTATTMISQVNVERSFLRLTNVFAGFESLEIQCVATNDIDVVKHTINIATVGKSEFFTCMNNNYCLFWFRILWGKHFDRSGQSWFTVAAPCYHHSDTS